MTYEMTNYLASRPQLTSTPIVSMRQAWEKPEQNHKAANSTASPWLIQPLMAALIAVLPISAGAQQVDLSVLPVSSGHIKKRDSVIVWTPVNKEKDIAEPEIISGLIENLRKGFGLSDSSLAEIFGVSRQTIYNWRTKKTLTDHPERISALADSLANVSKEDAPYLRRTLFYPSHEGCLLQDVLSDEGWISKGAEGVHNLVAELAQKAAQLRARDEKTISRLEMFSKKQAG
ncbi:helix-turn-helix domain-containing protein [Azomonas macrocytogenes]|uniref:Transcriptional regulator with XRE-family HTH domain n=1 Tax=Azomonas macrocytogenes TaxID=69962 RepID=A0A839T6R4_AZOMA|nr:transcriptional regulator [Azomonas macrocytogenes]MBB3105171.1 transcriptional regulator with XRE-family HTH domain [Azomonas macrocytogenes]